MNPDQQQQQPQLSQQEIQHLLQERQQLFAQNQQLQATLAAARQQQPAAPIAPVVVNNNSARAASRPHPFIGGISKNVSQWLFTLQVYFKAIKVVDPAEQADVGATFLEGDAMTWWMSIMDQHPNIEWQEFKDLITARYSPVEAKKNTRDRILQVRQTTNVAEFCARFQTLCNEMAGEFQEVTLVSLFIKGLHPEIRKFVELSNPTTVVAAMGLAQRVEYSSRGSSRSSYKSFHNHSYRNNYSSNPSTAAPMELGHVGDQEQEQEQEQQNEEESVLNAAYDPRRRSAPFRGPSRRGAFRRLDDATHQRRFQNNECFECGKQGHFGRDCPLRKPRVASVAATAAQPKNE